MTDLPRKFALERPPFVTPTFAGLLLGAAVGAGAGFVGPWVGEAIEQSRSVWLPLFTGLLGLGLLVALLCGLRMMLRPAAGAVIELGETHAALPASSRSTRLVRFAYDDIDSLAVYGTGRWARLLIATRRRNFIYPVTHLAGGAAALAALRTALREAIAAHPGGTAHLHAIDERDARGAEFLKRPPRVTLALLGINVAVYVRTRLAGAHEDPFGLIAFGANAPALVEAGEWYRLLSANFLHINLLHLYLNGFGMLVLGLLLERLVGPWRFLTIYLVSAVAGAAASAYVSAAALSVGASTAVFGLLGALGFVNWRFRGRLPGGFRQPLRWWMIILGINAALPFLVPMIDWAAHAGGFAAGALVAALACREGRDLEPPHAVGPALKTATAVLAIVFAAALGEAVTGDGRDASSGYARVVGAYVDDANASPEALNSLAWRFATDARATVPELEVAERAARRALRTDPENAAYLDTLATVHYRRGELELAIATQRRAVAADERRVLVSQMGRFLAARSPGAGVFATPGTRLRGVSLGLEDRGARRALVLELPREIERGLELYVLAERDSELVGTLRVLVGAGTSAGRHRLRLPSEPIGLEDAALRIAFADATACDCEPRRIRARYFEMAPEVERLP